MERPRIFIGSSTEGLGVANAVHQNLDRFAEVTIWTQGLFQLSVPTITNLLRALNDFDFAIFIFYPDDITNLRGQNVTTVRDNVIFETGLFAGKLGIERVYFLRPRGQAELHLPSDLLGLTAGEYDANRVDKNFVAATGPFCGQVIQQITRILKTQPDNERNVVFGTPEIDNDSDLRFLLVYLFDKNLTAMSFEKIQKNVHPKFTEEYVMNIAMKYPHFLRRSILKNGLPGIKLVEQGLEKLKQ
jgi:CAP12/Pycsar effector protein, TIR domain